MDEVGFMDEASEFAAIITNRENLYRFLARLYRVEVDAPLLQQLGEMGFPTECGDPNLAEGYRMLTDWLRDPGSDPLTDLAVDYARTFLGAGVFQGVVANPYESVYTSEKRLIMQEARDQVLAVYRAKGLRCAEPMELPEDHIALELEFLAYLCRETLNVINDRARVSTLLKEQKEFIERHPAKWIPAFCADIAKCAATDFYKAVGKITLGFLNMERAILEDLLEKR
ncbi:MAG: molecular chaperone TorD family protein [Acidobacteriota bacterium]|nr:molecular chaperone TorD family protein [Acidobacteriota bacterium]